MIDCLASPRLLCYLPGRCSALASAAEVGAFHSKFHSSNRRRRRGRSSFTLLALASVADDGGASSSSRKTHQQQLMSVLERAKPKEGVGEEVMRLIANATSSPIAQYLPSPATPLHSLDPRVKQAWLLALVFIPARSHMMVRLGLVSFLVFASIRFLPERIWKDQLGRMIFFSVLLLVMVSFGTDGVPPLVQTRTPPAAMDGLPALPPSLEGYSYVLWKLGPFQLTRKGLALGVTATCLSFTVLQSASLCLATTMPEHLAAGLRWYMAPLAYIKVPVDELVLTLLLSLRFIGIVFDEVRNIALGIVARGVQWKSLTLLETADVFITFVGRIFKNLFNHAEQIAQAMVARGFRGNPATHKIYFLTKFSLKKEDYFALTILAALLCVGVFSEVLMC